MKKKNKIKQKTTKVTTCINCSNMISIFIPVDVFLDFVHLHLQKKRQTNKNKTKTTNKQNNLTKTNQTKNNKSKNQEDIVQC